MKKKDVLAEFVASSNFFKLRNLDSKDFEAAKESFLFRLPPLFENMLLNYEWPSFEVGEIQFLPNPPRRDWGQLWNSFFYDNGFRETLESNRMVPFGRLSGGSWDPICFDMSRKSRDGEIFILDHEAILIGHKVKVVRKVSSGFEEFLRSFSNAEKVLVENES